MRNYLKRNHKSQSTRHSERSEEPLRAAIQAIIPQELPTGVVADLGLPTSLAAASGRLHVCHHEETLTTKYSFFPFLSTNSSPSIA